MYNMKNRNYEIVFSEELMEQIDNLKHDKTGDYRMKGTVYVTNKETGFVGRFIIKTRYEMGYFTVNKYLVGSTCLEDSMEYHYSETKIGDTVLFSNILEMMIEANFLM